MVFSENSFVGVLEIHTMSKTKLIVLLYISCFTARLISDLDKLFDSIQCLVYTLLGNLNAIWFEG